MTGCKDSTKRNKEVKCRGLCLKRLRISFTNVASITQTADEGGSQFDDKPPTPLEETLGIERGSGGEQIAADIEAPLDSTGPTQVRTGSPQKSSVPSGNADEIDRKETPISFVPPPRVRGMTRGEKRRQAGVKQLQEARELVLKDRDDKKAQKSRLDDVAVLLEGHYSMDIAKAAVDTLDLEDIEVYGSLSVRPYHVGQRAPKVRGLIRLDKINEAISAIRATGNEKLLANWPDYGYATLDQLEAMSSVQIKDVQPPFIDLMDKTKQEYKKTATAMRLDKVSLGPEWYMGYTLVDFREKLWLHTSSIISAMLALKSMYSAGGAVGVLKSNLKVLKSGVQSVIEPLIGMKDRLTYEKITWCIQKDNTSCGVWCLSILELLLAGHPWVDSLYKVQPYLRLRYLFMAINMQCEAV
ncbi:hypothetical protein F443_18229 [Phytophthora nicotianae P1569]|uniref:Ubiquitin-like protease family profile domain-containing protein n=1 Tax=Phytophthora nicotianae P1569 TaxID=1317065 RepID=V9E8L6_PHYNI|nr:hypothetical protein F443_18229 [Phytophthora nicotianae P1569]